MKKNKKIALQIFILSIGFALCDENPDRTFSNFEKSSNICDKCECSTYANLFVLDCSHRDLHNTLSNWPDHRNKTLRASFRGNIITTLEKFPASNSTVFLTLNHCGIKFLAPGLFENMKNVTYVDMSYNLITVEQLSSEKFKGPFNNDDYEPIELTHLNLAYNKIHSLPKSLAEHMPKLKQLNLEGNDLKILDLQTQVAISSMPSLEYLNLANNELEDLPNTAFMDLQKLIGIDLSKNRMRFVPEILSKAGKLRTLIFDSNPIYELADGTFNGMPFLKELSLNNLSNVVEIHSHTFSSLRYLKRLHLSNNKDLELFESEVFGVGNDKIQLRELYMNNNNLIDIPSDLLIWSQLHIFEFNDNPLMCSCNLYNITKNLNRQILRNKAGPYCIGEEETSYQVFDLNERVCDEDYVVSYSFRSNFSTKFSIIRVSLITLSLITLTGTFIAIVVCFAKQRKYDFLGQNNFSRSTNVLYNPLNRQNTL